MKNIKKEVDEAIKQAQEKEEADRLRGEAKRLKDLARIAKRGQGSDYWDKKAKGHESNAEKLEESAKENDRKAAEYERKGKPKQQRNIARAKREKAKAKDAREKLKNLEKRMSLTMTSNS